MGAHILCRHSAIRRNHILCGVCPVSQNLYDFYIVLVGKYASYELRWLSQTLRKVVAFQKKYVKSPQDFVDFHFAATQDFHRFFFFFFFGGGVHISQPNWKYRMIVFNWYVLCMGRKRITLSEPMNIQMQKIYP